MSFHVGQKVVCVDDRLGWCDLPQKPTRGHVYTIRALPVVNGTTGVWLEELVNPKIQFLEGLAEPRFHPKRFRPVVERKTDISIFTKILDDVSKQRDLRAVD